MKKTYCTPSLKALKIETSYMLAVSGIGQGPEDQQLDSKAYNSGSGIWGSMSSDDDAPDADED